LSAEIRPRVWAYIGGIAKNNGMKAAAVGGVEDHVHSLLWIPPDVAVSDAVRHIKGASSRWITSALKVPMFDGWQVGYGVFSVGIEGIGDVVDYIRNQEKHHQSQSFKDEYVAILKKHGIEDRECLL